jgi:choline monooxygenase
MLPVEPERSLAIFEWYLPEKDPRITGHEGLTDFSDQIQIEDVGICEAVQKNWRSRSYSRGPFSVKRAKGVPPFIGCTGNKLGAHRRTRSVLRNKSAR